MLRKARVAIILCLVLLITGWGTVFADASTPTANAVGAGGVGPYKSPGQMVKVMFYKPSDFGVGADWKTSKPAFIEVKSKSERTIWEMGSRENPMDDLQLTGSGQDAYALSQLYIAVDGEGWGNSEPNLTFLTGKSGTDMLYTDVPGAFGIVTNNVDGGSYGGTNSYEASNGLLGCDNIYMRKLLQVTDNGKVWEGEKISKAIEELWAENIQNGTALGSEATRLRYDMARMLTSTPGGGLEVQYSMQKLDTFMNEQIKNGSTPPGMGVAIGSEAQATNIRNLVLATFVLVQGNPDGGITFNTGSVGGGHHKGHFMRDRLMEWAKAGGNSDSSDFHCAIKFESYGMVDCGGNWARAERWDYANWVSCREGTRQDYIKPANWAQLNGDRTRPDTLSLGQNYVNQPYMGMGNPAIDAFKKLIYGVQTQLANNGQTLWLHWADDPFTSRWSIFGSGYPRADGTVFDGTNSRDGTPPNHYNYRGIFEYTPKCFEAGGTTVNLGYSFLAPDGKGGPPPEAAKPADYKEDAVVSTKTTILKGDAKGEVDVKYSMEMSEPDKGNKDTYNLKYDDTDDWSAKWKETDRALQLLHRAFYYSDDRLNSTTNKYLPIRIEIKRENGGSGQILDELSGVFAELRDCPGDHRFKVESDSGGTAVITFNMAAQTWCPNKEVPFLSPIRTVLGQDPQWKIENCLASSVFDKGLTMDFKDKDIDVGAGKTDVKYTFSADIGIPDYKLEPDVFGSIEVDEVYQIRMSNQKFLGWKILPEGGAVYPNSDWVAGSGGYVFSDKIQRKVTFERVNEKIPTYTNQGYEAQHPYYAEIKTGTPTNEPFEAMAGTPTTENLYMSVGATDFRVSFDGAPDPAVNPADYLKYTYIVNVSGCYQDGLHCTGCGSCTQPCPGHPWATEDASGIDFCPDPQIPHSIEHPNGSHTWTYVVNIPIGVFNYFDMTDSEAWRLTQWGLTGHEAFLTAPNPQKALQTQFWGYNQQNYSSGNGRLIFNATQNSNQQGSLAKYGNQTRTFSISGGPHSAMVTQALALVNGALASEQAVGATVVSDYMVLGTSEGYQTPFFYTQDSKNTVTPSSAGTFSGEGGNLTCPTKIEFDEKKMDDYWWQNNNKLTCAQPLNGWDNRSITYGGYNGQYSNLSAKYNNTDHSNFVSTTNTAAEFFSSKSLSLNTHPNGVRDGGSTSIGIGKGNTNHIVTGLDVIDTTANGEYNTGKMWLQYNRVMFYDNNANLGVSSGAVSDFDGVNGVYRNSNIPYYANATKVNDIVIHDPVSAQYAIVKSNPTEYDLRTNAELMQGGDPVGTKLGACPGMGCQFSTLTCTRTIEPHNDSCYSEVKTGTNHVGGLNTHVCNDDCKKVGGGLSILYATTGVQSRYITYFAGTASKNTSLLNYIERYWYSCHYDGHFGVDLDLNDTDNYNLPSSPYYTSLGVATKGYWCDTHAVYLNPDYESLYTNYALTYGKGTPEYYYWVGWILATYNSSTYISEDPTAFGGKGIRITDTYTGSGGCTGELNTHVCTAACTNTYTKKLICTDPHHYEPGQPVDATSLNVHYPIGDMDCQHFFRQLFCGLTSICYRCEIPQ